MAGVQIILTSEELCNCGDNDKCLHALWCNVNTCQDKKYICRCGEYQTNSFWSMLSHVIMHGDWD